MPKRKLHTKIDEEILKPLNIIPKDMETEIIHGAMDEGTDDFGPNHRFMDKWHDPEYVARVGFHSKNNGNIPEDFREEYMYRYRIAKFHLVVDELCTRYKKRYDKEPDFNYYEKKIKEIKNNEKIYKRHFAHYK